MRAAAMNRSATEAKREVGASSHLPTSHPPILTGGYDLVVTVDLNGKGARPRADSSAKPSKPVSDTLSAPVQSVSGDVLRAFMRHVASPVTVVTLAHGGERRGVTIGSFTSLSLDPPLVSFNVQKSAQSHALLLGGSPFAVHVLADDQGALSTHFSNPKLGEAQQFAGVDMQTDAETGLPLLRGTLGALICRPYALHEAGDHTLVIGEVERVVPGATQASPLLYVSRAYHRVGERVPG
jgi:flavin reductase (DIM6/NTAB) family NADH-FMN oxidoreductase RutF